MGPTPRKAIPRNPYFDPERLRRAREAKGLSQAALAEQLGKNPDSVRGYEAGRIEPPGHVVAEIARITGKPRHWFIGDGAHKEVSPIFDPDAPPVPPGLQTLVDMGLPLRADELRDLVAYADPMNPSRGARDAMGWTPGEWLNVLIEDRRRRALGP